METPYISSTEAVRILGIHRSAVARLIRRGRLPAMRVANRWLLQRSLLQDIARNYVGKRGRPPGWRPRTEAKE